MMLKHSVRIIGGRWRGRKLNFPQDSDVRPTLDQVRETLFNWLQPMIQGARCLDMFAGSGALGIEALSRGASHVTFIDQNDKILTYIKNNLIAFSGENYTCLQTKMPQGLSDLKNERYDIVFLDPPFASNLLDQALSALETGSLLNPHAMIYIETSAEHALPLANEFRIHRIKRTKHIQYGLLELLNRHDRMS